MGILVLTKWSSNTWAKLCDLSSLTSVRNGMKSKALDHPICFESMQITLWMPPSVAIWPGSSIIAVIPIVTQKSLLLTEKAKLSFIPSSPLHMARKLLMITNSPLKMRRLGAFVERKSAGSISIEKQQQKKKKFQSFRQVFGFCCIFTIWLSSTLLLFVLWF